MNFFKRNLVYNGLDCIEDMESDEYMMAKTKLQTAVPWASQVDYGYYTIYFCCAVLVAATIKHAYYTYRDHQYKKGKTVNGLNSFVDICVSYARYFGYKQIPAKLSYFTSLPPSGGSSLFLMASTLYLSLYSFVPHFWYRGCRGFGSPPLAVRTGIMATALTPFIYILAGKANMITLFTGISYEKLNYIHQYVGVATLVLSLVHTIPFFYQALVEGGQLRLNYFFRTNFYFYSGVPPLALLVFLCVFSKSFIRKYFYEAFLHCHWIFGAGYFATLGWHVYGQLETDHYIWAALVFWITQLVYRALVKTCFKPNSLFMKPRQAELVKSKGSKAIQVTVTNTKDISWKPGQHVFMRFVGSRFLDNHPFSIANTPDVQDDNKLQFLIVPKRGLTSILYNELQDSIVQKKKVFIDGPYGGCSRDCKAFNKVVLISTGSGITAVLPFLLELANHIHKSVSQGELFVTQEVQFIWIVRTLDDVVWFKSEIEKCLEIAGDYIKADIYICHESPNGEVVEPKDSPKDDNFDNQSLDKVENNIESKTRSSIENDHSISFLFFKPIVEDLLIQHKPALKRRNMIVSSGSSSMRFAVSNTISSFQALIANKDQTGIDIDEVFLHTETFGW